MTFEEWMQSKGLDDTPALDAFLACWRAAQAQCAAGEWRDIKDAPKDGTRVLVRGTYGKTVFYEVPYWDKDCYYDDEPSWMTDCGRISANVTNFAPLREVQT